MKTDDDTVLSLDRLAVLIHKLEREEEDGDGVRCCCVFVLFYVCNFDNLIF